MKHIRINRKSTIIFIFFLFINTFFLTNSAVIQATKPLEISSIEEKRDLYYLHHRIIPGMLFSDNGGRFFNDLFFGKTDPFMKMVEKFYGKAYASGIKIVPEHYLDFDIVLMSFPKPANEPLNYHAALVRKNGNFRYITLEKGNSIDGAGVKSFFCEWTSSKIHSNFGPRSYERLTAFREELLTFLTK